MSTRADLPALDRYRIHAKRLGMRFQSLSSEQVLNSVAAYLPKEPASVLDVGAGSGRDAAWFARQGHRVTAVEPVREMADQAAHLPGAEHVDWITDHLPALTKLRGRKGEFDLCLLSGVWHHLPEGDRAKALTVLSALLRHGGRLVMSLRHGDDADGETNFAVDPEEAIGQAAGVGLRLMHSGSIPSNQPANLAAGVYWTWLVLQRPMGEAA